MWNLIFLQLYVQFVLRKNNNVILRVEKNKETLPHPKSLLKRKIQDQLTYLRDPAHQMYILIQVFIHQVFSSAHNWPGITLII